MTSTYDLITADLAKEGFSGEELNKARSAIVKYVVLFQEIGERQFQEQFELTGVIQRLVTKYGRAK